MDINININVEGGKPTVSVSKPAPKPKSKLGILKFHRKTKTGHETILRTPPMVEDATPQRMGILQGLGL